MVSPSQGSREDDGEELVSEFHRQNEKIKTLRKQLLDAKDELRYIIYTLLPTLNFRNVPVHEEFQLKTPISPTGTTTSTTSMDYCVRGIQEGLFGQYQLFEIIPGSESPDGSVVFRGAIKVQGGQRCLVKEIALDHKLDPLYVEQLDLEIGLLRDLHHDCIAHILHVERHPRIMHIYYDIDTDMVKLSDVISHFPQLGDTCTFARTFRNIMSALIYCHDKQYCHLNVNLSSILIRPRNCAAVLTGFYFCRRIDDHQIAKPFRCEHIGRAKPAPRCKSNWASPEVYWGVNDLIGAKSDVFSAAIVLLDLIYRRDSGFPFQEDDETNTSPKSLRQYFNIPVTWGFSIQSKIKFMINGITNLDSEPLGAESLKAMLLQMTAISIHERIEAREVMKDNWIRGVMVASNAKSEAIPASRLPLPSKSRELAQTERPWNRPHLQPLDRFVQASNYVHQNRMFFSTDDALRFYGLWMQSTEGPAIKYAGVFSNDAKSRRKIDAWRSHKMKSQITAMYEYVHLLNSLLDDKAQGTPNANNDSQQQSTERDTKNTEITGLDQVNQMMGLNVSPAKRVVRTVDNRSVSGVGGPNGRLIRPHSALGRWQTFEDSASGFQYEENAKTRSLYVKTKDRPKIPIMSVNTKGFPDVAKQEQWPRHRTANIGGKVTSSGIGPSRLHTSQIHPHYERNLCTTYNRPRSSARRDRKGQAGAFRTQGNGNRRPQIDLSDQKLSRGCSPPAKSTYAYSRRNISPVSFARGNRLSSSEQSEDIVFPGVIDTEDLSGW